MKRPTVLEAMKNLTVVKFTPYRDRPGGKAILQVPGNDREIEAWWHEPPKGEALRLHFRPYPDGWAQLSAREQAEASKEALFAIATHNAKTQKAPRGKQKRRR